MNIDTIVSSGHSQATAPHVALRLVVFAGLFALSSCVSVQAQSGGVNIVPPAPTAAALMEYADVPVSLYTGTPSIEIPLHTVTSGDLQVPISLSYHASGIRVDESAGAAGLGWTLNAGGSVTRVVRGLPDDLRDGYINTESALAAAWGYIGPYSNWTGSYFYGSTHSLVYPGWAYSRGLLGNASQNIGPVPWAPYSVNHDAYDPMPDIFAFNVGGVTGKMMILGPHDVVVYPRQAVKVEYSTCSSQCPSNIWNGNIESWTITGPDGTRYQFAAREKSQELLTVQGGLRTFTSAWHLTKISSAAGSNEINLTYSNPTEFASSTGTLANSVGSGYVDYRLIDANSINAHLVLSAGSNPPYSDGKREEVYVSTIVGDGERVVFSTQERRDLGSGGFPKARHFQDMLVETLSGLRISKSRMYHGYFNFGMAAPPLTRGLSSFNTSQRLMERLRLDSLVTFGVSDTLHTPSYSFQYYGGSNNDAIRLPPVTTRARDHWGFYNGAVQNNSASNQPDVMTPSVSGLLDASPFSPYSYNLTSPIIRDADATGIYAQVGSLKSILYPTGAKRSFEYESHDYAYVSDEQTPTFPAKTPAGGIRIKRILLEDGITPGSVVESEYAYVRDRDDIMLIGPADPQSPASSGVLVRNPRYTQDYHNELGVYLRTYGDDLNQTGLGPHVGYTQVRVTRPGSGSTVSYYLAANSLLYQGGTELAFDYDENTGSSPHSRSGHFYWRSREFKRGALLASATLDVAGNVETLDTYNYVFTDTNLAPPYNSLNRTAKAVNFTTVMSAVQPGYPLVDWASPLVIDFPAVILTGSTRRTYNTDTGLLMRTHSIGFPDFLYSQGAPMCGGLGIYAVETVNASDTCAPNAGIAGVSVLRKR